MAFDLHVHSRVSSDGGEDCIPAAMVEAAVAAGLGGFAITDHDVFTTPRRRDAFLLRLVDHRRIADAVAETMAAGEKAGLIVVPGVEVTSRHRTSFPHILAIGIGPEVLEKGIPSLYHPRDVLQWASANGGAGVVAHPKRDGALTSWTYEAIETYRSLITGIEIRGRREIKPNNQELALRLGLAPVLSSDAHHLDQIGRYATVFPRVARWQELVGLLRSRQVQGYRQRPGAEPDAHPRRFGRLMAAFDKIWFDDVV